MGTITTYRTIDSLSTTDGQNAVVSKLSEFLSDVRGVFNLDIVEIQTIAGRVYIHLSDAINRADMPPEYYDMEKASL